MTDSRTDTPAGLAEELSDMKQRLENTTPGKWTAENAEFIAHAKQDVGALLAALDQQTKQLAECYRWTGADPDGNEDWRLARHAVAEVKRLREESDRDADNADAVISALRSRLGSLEAERQQQGGGRMERAWVIERIGPEFWTGRDTEFTTCIDGTRTPGGGTKADNALRFARFEDAERARCYWLPKELRGFCKSVEHLWFADELAAVCRDSKE